MRNIYLFLILLFSMPSFGAACYEVSVDVDETKSNGDSWSGTVESQT